MDAAVLAALDSLEPESGPPPQSVNEANIPAWCLPAEEATRTGRTSGRASKRGSAAQQVTDSVKKQRKQGELDEELAEFQIVNSSEPCSGASNMPSITSVKRKSGTTLKRPSGHAKDARPSGAVKSTRPSKASVAAVSEPAPEPELLQEPPSTLSGAGADTSVHCTVRSLAQGSEGSEADQGGEGAPPALAADTKIRSSGGGPAGKRASKLSGGSRAAQQQQQQQQQQQSPQQCHQGSPAAAVPGPSVSTGTAATTTRSGSTLAEPIQATLASGTHELASATSNMAASPLREGVVEGRPLGAAEGAAAAGLQAAGDGGPVGGSGQSGQLPRGEGLGGGMAGARSGGRRSGGGGRAKSSGRAAGRAAVSGQPSTQPAPAAAGACVLLHAHDGEGSTLLTRTGDHAAATAAIAGPTGAVVEAPGESINGVSEADLPAPVPPGRAEAVKVEEERRDMKQEQEEEKEHEGEGKEECLRECKEEEEEEVLPFSTPRPAPLHHPSGAAALPTHLATPTHGTPAEFPTPGRRSQLAHGKAAMQSPPPAPSPATPAGPPTCLHPTAPQRTPGTAAGAAPCPSPAHHPPPVHHHQHPGHTEPPGFSPAALAATAAARHPLPAYSPARPGAVGTPTTAAARLGAGGNARGGGAAGTPRLGGFGTPRRAESGERMSGASPAAMAPRRLSTSPAALVPRRLSASPAAAVPCRLAASPASMTRCRLAGLSAVGGLGRLGCEVPGGVEGGLAQPQAGAMGQGSLGDGQEQQVPSGLAAGREGGGPVTAAFAAEGRVEDVNIGGEVMALQQQQQQQQPSQAAAHAAVTSLELEVTVAAAGDGQAEAGAYRPTGEPAGGLGEEGPTQAGRKSGRGLPQGWASGKARSGSAVLANRVAAAPNHLEEEQLGDAATPPQRHSQHQLMQSAYVELDPFEPPVGQSRRSCDVGSWGVEARTEPSNVRTAARFQSTPGAAGSSGGAAGPVSGTLNSSPEAAPAIILPHSGHALSTPDGRRSSGAAGHDGEVSESQATGSGGLLALGGADEGAGLLQASPGLGPTPGPSRPAPCFSPGLTSPAPSAAFAKPLYGRLPGLSKRGGLVMGGLTAVKPGASTTPLVRQMVVARPAAQAAVVGAGGTSARPVGGQAKQVAGLEGEGEVSGACVTDFVTAGQLSGCVDSDSYWNEETSATLLAGGGRQAAVHGQGDQARRAEAGRAAAPSGGAVSGPGACGGMFAASKAQGLAVFKVPGLRKTKGIAKKANIV